MPVVRSVYAFCIFGLLGASACASASLPAAEQRVAEPRFRDPATIIVADDSEGTVIPRSGQMHYPAEERARGVEAALAYVIVLDTAGKAEPRSIAILGNVPGPFVGVTCEWLRSARFYRVRRHGAGTRALVVGDLTFSLDQPGSRGEELLKRLDVAGLRRAIAAKGVAASARDLEAGAHCA
jgi:hypothetical protein